MSEAAIEAPLYHDTCHHKIYFMDCAEFDELHAFARGCCQICDLPERETPRGRLCIDHLGGYGQGLVRGLLCDRCNTLMRHVDNHTLPRFTTIPHGVYRYRNNAWCLRRLMQYRGWTVRNRRWTRRT